MIRSNPKQQSPLALTLFVIAHLMLLTHSFASIAQPNNNSKDEIQLRDFCPAGFEKIDHRCILRSLYQQYNSLYNKGVGGLKTALPQVRDGFKAEQIDLGRYLFFDPLLSGDKTQSCASCHSPEHGFSDAKPRASGHNGADVGRASPTLWNVAFLNNFFWDSRAHTLEEQMQGPLFSAKEMANTPEQLHRSLNASKPYQHLFKQAFADSWSGQIELAMVYQSIAAFESSLISLNSRYDRYAHGDHSALNNKEIEGLNVFRSFVARCAECHTPPLFTNQQIAVLGSPEPDGRALDIGAEKTTGLKELRAGFKVPSLRNITKTAPYFHSGKFKTLKEVVKFYTGGRGHAVSANDDLLLHWHIWEPDLSDEEIDRVVDFLYSLEDESFMPQKPTQLPSGLPLWSETQLKTQAAAGESLAKKNYTNNNSGQFSAAEGEQ